MKKKSKQINNNEKWAPNLKKNKINKTHFIFDKLAWFLEVIIFGSVRFLPLKNNQTVLKKKDPNRTGTGPNRWVPVRFGSGFWGPKPEKPMVLRCFASSVYWSSPCDCLPKIGSWDMVNSILSERSGTIKSSKLEVTFLWGL